ncbi:RluA family pseudouridine synthase [Thalassorhabdus alkalitolerans]|uniref:Pseudouridine synthase n=1 Tax=Thalassorhabdus alkalitolerans TaxID=2282697 RepID=A0ABW0YPQ4_9BACI
MNSPKAIWRVPSTFEEGTLRSFLRHEIGMSGRTLKAIKKEGNLLVNGREETVRALLKPEDTVTVCFPMEEPSEELEPFFCPLSILYEDEHLLIVDKPAGMATIPGRGERGCSLAEAVIHYYKEQKIPAAFHAVNRLDRDTSGIVTVAKHQYIHERLSFFQKEGRSVRRYTAVAEGSVVPKKGQIIAPIGRREGSMVERIVISTGDYAESSYKVIKEKDSASMIELTLETGRTHQIRVHMSHIGHPLAGDDLYGGSQRYIRRQALHSGYYSTIHPISFQKINVHSSLPPDMAQAWEAID